MFRGTIGCLVLVVVNGFLGRSIMVHGCTYVSSIDMSYDVLLEADLLDVLVHAFCMWLRYILRHVVDELMRWLCCT
jgi:hypothetical protein